MSTISRRDFLKLMSLLPMAAVVQPLLPDRKHKFNPDQPNIIVLVFDTWSANHMALHGYPRQTMPNIEKFANRATIFHNHYSPATFTVPGTASILTGLYPWSHRAVSLGGEITANHGQHQIFNVLSSTHSTLGYSQNKYSDLFLYQSGDDLERHVPIDSFSLEKGLIYNLPIFRNDPQVAFASFEDDIFQKGVGFDGSLFLGPIRRLIKWREREILNRTAKPAYSRGLPDSTELFTLEDLTDGAIGMLTNLPRPSLVYLHFYPPHGPYRPRGKFNSAFSDGWQAPEKPVHELTINAVSPAEQENQRRKYDQYLANWDAQIDRLLAHLETSGLLETSYVIITSDHGELFERGEVGHNGSLIYDPVIHIPLIISRPGIQKHIDVRTPTSNVDLLPTICSMAGETIPGWVEGMALPEFGGEAIENRSIFVLDAKKSSAHTRFKSFSFSLMRSKHRLTYYQYPELAFEKFEFYDLAEDPDEIRDIFATKPRLGIEMQDELLQKLADVNRPAQG